VTQFSSNTFALMWGYPYLVSGQGMEPAAASTLLTLFVLVNVVSGPFIGRLVARYPLRRSWLVLGIVGMNAAAWAAVLAWPPPAPAWLLVLLILCVAPGGPGSMIGFDFARPANPPERFGTASGIVNIGGFTASMVTLLAIGVLLDATGDDYRVAWSSIFVLQLLGTVQILRLRRRAERLERERIAVSRIESVHRCRAAVPD
jgi:MFS family permease